MKKRGLYSSWLRRLKVQQYSPSSVVVSYQLCDTMLDGGLEGGHWRGGEPLR